MDRYEMMTADAAKGIGYAPLAEACGSLFGRRSSARFEEALGYGVCAGLEEGRGDCDPETVAGRLALWAPDASAWAYGIMMRAAGASRVGTASYPFADHDALQRAMEASVARFRGKWCGTSAGSPSLWAKPAVRGPYGGRPLGDVYGKAIASALREVGKGSFAKLGDDRWARAVGSVALACATACAIVPLSGALWLARWALGEDYVDRPYANGHSLRDGEYCPWAFERLLGMGHVADFAPAEAMLGDMACDKGKAGAVAAILNMACELGHHCAKAMESSAGEAFRESGIGWDGVARSAADGLFLKAALGTASVPGDLPQGEPLVENFEDTVVAGIGRSAMAQGFGADCNEAEAAMAYRENEEALWASMALSVLSRLSAFGDAGFDPGR